MSNQPITNEKVKVLTARFFEDPEWKNVEDMILGFIEPLKDFNTIDVTQPAEHVKAEVIARMLAYNNLSDFLRSTRLVNREMKPFKNPFA